MSPKVSASLAVLVALVWAGSMVLDAYNPTYDPPAAIHAALMLVLGGIFGNRIIGGEK